MSNSTPNNTNEMIEFPTAQEILRNLGIDPRDVGAFFNAVLTGDKSRVELFLEAGMNPDVRGKDSDTTALIEASYRGYTEIVQILIDKGADVNAQGDYGYTALIAASAIGHTEIVQILIDKNAKVNEKNNGGYTALLVASQNGHTKVVQLLLDKGADVNAQAKDGHSALMWASQNGHTEIVQLLKNAGTKE